MDPLDLLLAMIPHLHCQWGAPSRLYPAFGPEYRGLLSGGFEAGLHLLGLRLGPLGLSSQLPIWGFQASFHLLLRFKSRVVILTPRCRSTVLVP
jgi:hypothetical protein